MAYAKSFRAGPKFCHNCVTSQINLGSAEGTTIIGWSEGMPRKNFEKLHLKIRIFIPVKLEAFRKPKKRLHVLRNPGRTPNTCKKPGLLLLKLLGFALQFFIFSVWGGMTQWPPSRYVSAFNLTKL